MKLFKNGYMFVLKFTCYIREKSAWSIYPSMYYIKYITEFFFTYLSSQHTISLSFGLSHSFSFSRSFSLLLFLSVFLTPLSLGLSDSFSFSRSFSGLLFLSIFLTPSLSLGLSLLLFLSVSLSLCPFSSEAHYSGLVSIWHNYSCCNDINPDNIKYSWI